MNHTTPDSCLDVLESQFNQLALAVAAGDTEVLVSLSEQVQQLTVGAADICLRWQSQGQANGLINQRLKALAEGLQVVRANLIRRATLVEQTLKLVVPATVEPTYAGSGAYGAGPKASGRFSAIAA